MKSIFGIFNSVSIVEEFLNSVEQVGIDSSEVSVVSKENSDLVALREHGTATANAVDGVASGGLVGGLAGLLAGLAAITITPIGSLLLAGPLVAALGLTGAGAVATSGALTGAVAGGLLGGLVKLGFPEDEAEKYQSKIMNGGILVSVNAQSNQENEIKNAFKTHNAEDITVIDRK